METGGGGEFYTTITTISTSVVCLNFSLIKI